MHSKLHLALKDWADSFTIEDCLVGSPEETDQLRMHYRRTGKKLVKKNQGEEVVV